MIGATLPALAPALLAISLAFPAASDRAATPSLTTASPDSLTATVRYVHQERRGMDVITGFHMALRLTYCRLAEGATITKNGETVRLQDLQPGDLVRIYYRKTDEGIIADSVRVLRSFRSGGGER